MPTVPIGDVRAHRLPCQRPTGSIEPRKVFRPSVEDSVPRGTQPARGRAARRSAGQMCYLDRIRPHTAVFKRRTLASTRARSRPTAAPRPLDKLGRRVLHDCQWPPSRPVSDRIDISNDSHVTSVQNAAKRSKNAAKTRNIASKRGTLPAKSQRASSLQDYK